MDAVLQPVVKIKQEPCEDGQGQTFIGATNELGTMLIKTEPGIYSGDATTEAGVGGMQLSFITSDSDPFLGSAVIKEQCGEAMCASYTGWSKSGTFQVARKPSGLDSHHMAPTRSCGQENTNNLSCVVCGKAIPSGGTGLNNVNIPDKCASCTLLFGSKPIVPPKDKHKNNALGSSPWGVFNRPKEQTKQGIQKPGPIGNGFPAYPAYTPKSKGKMVPGKMVPKKGHKQSMPYKCDTCGEEFHKSFLLDNHSLKHVVSEQRTYGGTMDKCRMSSDEHPRNTSEQSKDADKDLSNVGFPSANGCNNRTMSMHKNRVSSGGHAQNTSEQSNDADTELSIVRFLNANGCNDGNIGMHKNRMPSIEHVQNTSEHSNGADKELSIVGFLSANVCNDGNISMQKNRMPSVEHARNTSEQSNDADTYIVAFLCANECNDGNISELGNENDKPSKQYKCEDCGEEFGTAGFLIEHRSKHMLSEQYEVDQTAQICEKPYMIFRANATEETTVGETLMCDVCGDGFSDKTSLFAHRRTHMGIKRFICNICGKEIFGKQNFLCHRREHTKCDVCDVSFETIYHLNVHQKEHERKKDDQDQGAVVEVNPNGSRHKRYKCEFCGMRFVHHSRFVKHRNMHAEHKTSTLLHRQGTKSLLQLLGHDAEQQAAKHDISDQGVDVEQADGGGIVYECKDCKMYFIQHEHLVKHKEMHTSHRVKRYIRSTRKPVHICDECDKSFSSYANLAIHRELCYKGKPLYNTAQAMSAEFVCDKHGESYCNYASLPKHKKKDARVEARIIETPEKMDSHENEYQCNVCGRKFADHSKWFEHCSAMRTFDCDVCGQIFCERTAWLEHSHTSKQYMCDVCGKEFDERTKWLKHIYRFKPYKCFTCGKTFDVRKLLNGSHQCKQYDRFIKRKKMTSGHWLNLQKRGPYKCGTCRKQFISCSGVIEHKQIHTGGSYFCEICKVWFTAFSVFIDHHKMHLASQPRCDICSVRFSTHIDYVSHLSKTCVAEHCCCSCGKKFLRKSSLVEHYQVAHWQEALHM